MKNVSVEMCRSRCESACATFFLTFVFWTIGWNDSEAQTTPLRPNILWITSEDNGPELGCYGDLYATTPNLDRLAADGLRYEHCWSNAPVCAPARTTIISGLYPTTTGSQHMRSNVAFPPELELYPQVLRRAGYYCCNRSKEDYNLKHPGDLWDDSSSRAHWRNRAPEQPFFAVVNFTISHESQIRTRPHQPVHDPQQMPLPPFHPDLPEVRQDWAQYYDKVSEMDRQVGNLLAELERDGLRDNTIIFYYGDHGTGMPRGKRWLYETGLRVPLIVWAPQRYYELLGDEYQRGMSSDRLVSFVDLYPTILSLLNIEIPSYLAGSAFLGPAASEPREFMFGFRDRMDERYDMSRAVRSVRYAYIRNYLPHRKQGQYLDYMFQTPTTVAWQQAFVTGQCNDFQSAFWLPKPPEELYDLENDPFQIHNLTDDPEFQETLERMRQALADHMTTTRDLGFLPEAEMHRRSRGVTPYELGQDNAGYPLERIRTAAEMATRLDLADAARLVDGLDDPEAAVRYWAIVGLLWRGLSNDDPVAPELLGRIASLQTSDTSTSVRSVAGEFVARLSARIDSANSSAVRSLAIQHLTEDATSHDAAYFDSVEALNALIHSEPTAVELAHCWGKLGKLNRPGEPRVDFYLTRLLAALPRQLNVVVLVSDDQRWDSLGVAGNTVIKTPHLDRLANQGVHFTEARVTTSICMTSRASILTGQYMARHGIDRFGKAITPEAFRETYQGQLRDAGYWTGFVGKYGIGQARAADFDFLRSYEVKHWHTREGETVHVTELNRRDALEFLRSRPADKPFLLSVSFFAPHAEDAHPEQYLPQPWSAPLYDGVVVPPARFGASRYLEALPTFLSDPKNEGRVRFGWRFDSAEKYQQMMVNYYRLITEVDAAIGDLVSELERQGVADNTLVLFMGDNGYFHGDRGLADKWYPYEQALRVPLIVYDPRLPQPQRGQQREALVLNIDLAPTVLHAAGLPASSKMQGQDLSPLYMSSSQTPWREFFLYEHPTITDRQRIPSSQAVIRKEQKFVHWPEWDYEQFFDLQTDPEELHNRAETAEYAEIVRAGREELETLLRQAK